MNPSSKTRTNQKGFTLIELLVVVLIIGILASLAVPQYFKVVERSRVSEAYSLISNLKAAQERYLAKNGGYASDLTTLDIAYPNTSATNIVVKYYDMACTVDNNVPNYELALTRIGNVAARYGAYTITVNVPDNPIPTSSDPNTSEILD